VIKYLKRNGIVKQMVDAARQERNVEQWMLEYVDLWYYFGKKVMNPKKFGELPLNTRNELLRKKKR
jgi:hypothetical protein